MDRSVEKIRLIMLKEGLGFEKKDLPDGYSFEFYKNGMKDIWIDINLASDHILDREKGETEFAKDFLQDEKFLKENMIFVKDPKGKYVGTGSIWYGDYFEDSDINYRVHWVAVDKENDGKGIGKAIVSKLLEIFEEKKLGDKIYLSTQTCSYVAIKIYEKFGFKPYNMEEDKRGWDIVDNMLK